MNKQTGISVYVGLTDYSLADTLKYLEKAADLGIDFVFTSAHIPEADIEGDFQVLLDKCDELNLPIVVDVSKKIMDKFTLPKSLGALRLDYGFTKEEVAEYSNTLPYMIELNASNMTRTYLNTLKSLNANFNNIRVSYNFYPKRYTGMDLENVKKLNELYHEFGLTVFGYVPSNSGKRPPLYDGLPSVESHRDLDLLLSTQELFAAGCDGVCVGDAYISEDDFNKLSTVKNEFIIPIKVYPNLTKEELEILEYPHHFRIDEGSYMKRSSKTRGIKIEPYNTKNIEPFMITIDNILYKRYTGEVSIALRKMENKGFVNVVGKVISDAETLVELIKPGSKFKFKIEGYINE